MLTTPTCSFLVHPHHPANWDILTCTLILEYSPSLSLICWLSGSYNLLASTYRDNFWIPDGTNWWAGEWQGEVVHIWRSHSCVPQTSSLSSGLRLIFPRALFAPLCVAKSVMLVHGYHVPKRGPFYTKKPRKPVGEPLWHYLEAKIVSYWLQRCSLRSSF